MAVATGADNARTRTAADVLSEQLTLEDESIELMYHLNLYVPQRQTAVAYTMAYDRVLRRDGAARQCDRA